MVYDIELLKKNRFNVVFGGSENEREKLSELFLNQYPDYKVEMCKRFSAKKVGPFTMKNNDRLKQILLSDKVLQAKGENYVMQMASMMCFDFLLDRYPRNLSYYQRLLPSLLLDVVHGKTKYLFCDNMLKSNNYFFYLMRWLEAIDEFRLHDGCIIWITYLSKKTLLSAMLEMNFEIPCEMFELKDNTLIHHENMFEDYKAKENSEITKMMKEVAVGTLDQNTLEHLLKLLQIAKNIEYIDEMISIIDYHLIENEDSTIYLNAMGICKKMKDILLNHETDLSSIEINLTDEEDYIDNLVLKHIA